MGKATKAAGGVAENADETVSTAMAAALAEPGPNVRKIREQIERRKAARPALEERVRLLRDSVPLLVSAATFDGGDLSAATREREELRLAEEQLAAIDSSIAVLDSELPAAQRRDEQVAEGWRQWMPKAKRARDAAIEVQRSFEQAGRALREFRDATAAASSIPVLLPPEHRDTYTAVTHANGPNSIVANAVFEAVRGILFDTSDAMWSSPNPMFTLPGMWRSHRGDFGVMQGRWYVRIAEEQGAPADVVAALSIDPETLAAGLPTRW